MINFLRKIHGYGKCQDPFPIPFMNIYGWVLWLFSESSIFWSSNELSISLEIERFSDHFKMLIWPIHRNNIITFWFCEIWFCILCVCFFFFFFFLCFSVSFRAAIIGIIGYADALKATSLKTFGRNGNKTASAATSKTTTSTTVATVNTEPTSDDEVNELDLLFVIVLLLIIWHYWLERAWF